MKKLVLFILLSVFSHSVYSQVAYVAGAKVNQPYDNFMKSIDTSQFTKTGEKTFVGTFSGFENTTLYVTGYDGWVDCVTINVPTDGTLEHGKKIVDSFVLAYQKKYGSETMKFKKEEYCEYGYQLCNGEICFTISVAYNLKSVRISYVVRKRDLNISEDEI